MGTVQDKILLVEFNPINIVVMKETLDALGIQVDVVNNGAQALERLSSQTSHYPVLLMDSEMPEMDGYETTRQIRQGKAGNEHQDIPIIALCSSEKEGLWGKCSAAGMNDYLTMPIEPEVLNQKLGEWRKTKAVKTKTVVEVRDTSELAVWDEDDALTRMRGKKARLTRLIEMFLKNLPENMQALQDSLESMDIDDAKDKAHAIKGVAANIGGLKLMVTMSDCEEACKEGNIQLAQELLPQCLQHAEQLSERLSLYINS